MKKSVSVFLSILAVLALMLSLTGCGEQKKFIGTWESTIDITDYINEGLAEDAEMAEYLEIDEFELVVNVTFKEDGTYKMRVDEDEAEDALESLRKDFKKGMTDYFEDYIASAGLDVTVDEALEASDVDLDTLVDETFGDDFLDTLVEEMESEGNFVAKGGKLYLSDGLDNNIDEDVYDTYEISDDEFTLIESFGSDEEDELGLYPMTFEKID